MTGNFSSLSRALDLYTRSRRGGYLFGSNFEFIEVKGHLNSQGLLLGAVIFYDPSGSEICPLELRKVSGITMENSHRSNPLSGNMV